MRDPQLTKQMSDFSKRKSSGPGDPPKKKKKSIKPAAEIQRDKNDMLASVKKSYPDKIVTRNKTGSKNNSFTVGNKDGLGQFTIERSLSKK